MSIPVYIIQTIENNNPSDTVISISQAGLSDFDMYQLVLLLNNNDYITELDLASNNISNAGAKELSKLKKITKINLEFNNVSEKGAVALIGNLNFECLNLSRNNLHTYGMQELLDAKNSRGKPIRLNVTRNLLGVENESKLQDWENQDTAKSYFKK